MFASTISLRPFLSISLQPLAVLFITSRFFLSVTTMISSRLNQMIPKIQIISFEALQSDSSTRDLCLSSVLLIASWWKLLHFPDTSLATISLDHPARIVEQTRYCYIKISFALFSVLDRSKSFLVLLLLSSDFLPHQVYRA